MASNPTSNLAPPLQQPPLQPLPTPRLRSRPRRRNPCWIRHQRRRAMGTARALGPAHHPHHPQHLTAQSTLQTVLACCLGTPAKGSLCLDLRRKKMSHSSEPPMLSKMVHKGDKSEQVHGVCAAKSICQKPRHKAFLVESEGEAPTLHSSCHLDS